MSNDVGLLLSRSALGASIAAHGAQKAWGWFDGPGPQGAAGFLESLRFIPGARFARAAAITEMASGALIALGLGGPVGPAALLSTMIVAQTTVHAKNGYFSQKNGIELGVMYAAGALALASGGYGRISLDRAFGWQRLHDAWPTTLILLAGVAAAYTILAQRSPAIDPAEPQASSDASLAAVATHIAAASEDRPVPADLLVASDDNAAPQL